MKAVQIPGAAVPDQPTRAYRLNAIRQRVQASEAVVDLLATLAFGAHHEWTPAAFRPAPASVEAFR